MKNIFFTIILSLAIFANEKITYDEYAFKNGEEIYKQTCISCHAKDGSALTDMKLIVKPRDLTKTILDKEQIYKIVRDGGLAWGAGSDIMPSFKSVLNDEYLKDVSLYIYENFAKKSSHKADILLKKSTDGNINLEYGEKVYKNSCFECHGIKGRGNSDYLKKLKQKGQNIFPYDLSKIVLNQEQIFLYAKYGGKFWGSFKNDMKPLGEKYDDTALKSVAKYIEEVIKNNP